MNVGKNSRRVVPLEYFDELSTNDIAALIVHKRRDLGVSQDRLAGSLGMSRSTLSKYETGKFSKSTSSFMRALDYLQITEKDLEILEQPASNATAMLERSHPVEEIPHTQLKRNYNFAEKIRDRPKAFQAVIENISVEMNEAVNVLLQQSGRNRLPEGLDAFRKIPVTLTNIATSIRKDDFDALVKYIQELEEQNHDLVRRLKEKETKSRWEVFLDEGVKTAASWQAWATLGTATLAIVAQLESDIGDQVFECIEDYAPEHSIDDPQVLDVYG